MPNKCANALAKIGTSQPVDFVFFYFIFFYAFFFYAPPIGVDVFNSDLLDL